MNIWDDWDIEEIELTDNDFIKFLKYNNIYDRFNYNIINFKSNNWNNSLCDELYRYEYIRSFNWFLCKEHHSYWNEIHYMWQKYIWDNLLNKK